MGASAGAVLCGTYIVIPDDLMLNISLATSMLHLIYRCFVARKSGGHIILLSEGHVASFPQFRQHRPKFVLSIASIKVPAVSSLAHLYTP